MKFKNQKLLAFFWLALLTDCAIIFLSDTDPSYAQYRIFTKGILMPLLLIYFYTNVSSRKHHRSRVLAGLALLTAWVADLLLLFPVKVDFAIGFGILLLSQMLYCIYFYRILAFNFKSVSKLSFAILALIIVDVLFFRLMTYSLKKEHFFLPALVLMVVSTILVLLTSNIQSSKRASSLASNFFIPAALLLFASDGLFIYNKFFLMEENLYIPVVLTYGYAQQLFVQGLIKHLKEG